MITVNSIRLFFRESLASLSAMKVSKDQKQNSNLNVQLPQNIYCRSYVPCQGLAWYHRRYREALTWSSQKFNEWFFFGEDEKKSMQESSDPIW